MNDQNYTKCDGAELSREYHAFIKVYSLIVERYGNLITGTCGMLLNFITIIVLSTPKMRNNVFNRLLMCLAIFDNVYLFCEITEVFRVWNYSDFQQYFFAKCIYPIRSLFMCSSIYTNIALASERYRAVTSPVEYRIRRNTKVARKLMKYIMPVLAISVLYNIPKFYEIELDVTYQCYKNNSSNNLLDTIGEPNKHNNCTMKYTLAPTELRMNHTYLLWYTNISNLFITALLPIGVLLYLNLTVYLSSGKVLTRRSSISSFQLQQSVDLKRTSILFSIFFVFLFCQSLRFILNVCEFLRFSQLKEEQEIKCEAPEFWERIVVPLNQLFLILNASAHFFIYVFFDREYQDVLKGLFTKDNYQKERNKQKDSFRKRSLKDKEIQNKDRVV